MYILREYRIYFWWQKVILTWDNFVRYQIIDVDFEVVDKVEVKCLHNLKMEKLKFLHKSCFFGGTAGLFLVIIISVSHQHSVVSVGNDTSHSDKYEQPPATVWLVAQLSETTKTSLDHK